MQNFLARHDVTRDTEGSEIVRNVYSHTTDSGEAVIVKVFDEMEDDDEDLVHYRQELKIAQKMSDLGIGPHVIGHHIEEDEISDMGMLMMTGFTTTLEQYLNQHPSSESWELPLFKLLRRIANVGYVCADTHLRNIVLNTTATGAVTSMVAIDFGSDFCRKVTRTIIPTTIATHRKRKVVNNILVLMFYLNSQTLNKRFLLRMLRHLIVLEKRDPNAMTMAIDVMSTHTWITERIEYYNEGESAKALLHTLARSLF